MNDNDAAMRNLFADEDRVVVGHIWVYDHEDEMLVCNECGTYKGSSVKGCRP